MLVSSLQQFLKLMVPPLTAAGLNKTAETNLTKSLEELAHSLEPFKNHTLEDLATTLKNIDHFRQTGELPKEVFDTRPARASTRKPATPKAPKLSFQDAIAKLRELQERADTLDHAQIKAEVDALNALSVAELINVQKEFLGAAVGKTKPQKLESLHKALTTFARTLERSASILSS